MIPGLSHLKITGGSTGESKGGGEGKGKKGEKQGDGPLLDKKGEILYCFEFKKAGTCVRGKGCGFPHVTEANVKDLQAKLAKKAGASGSS